MAHLIEEINGVAQMAYAGETPWHGLGKQVPNDLLPEQMLEAAGLNWTVQKIPAFADINGTKVNVGHSALVRSIDDSVLDVVSNDWNPVQNLEAFEFFDEFVKAGDMEMNTAGSLKNGQIVWGLAKIKDSFEVFKEDRIDSYLLFTNFHKYGFSTDIRFTPIRVVCNNTLTLSLSSKVERMVKISHRKEFKPDVAKEMLGIATSKLQAYKWMAEFLGSKKAKEEDIVEYFKRVYPVTSNVAANDNKISRNANLALDILNTQPGANFAEGSWWQPFNAVTYIQDHLAARNAENRLTSSWYGQGKNIKNNALELALDFANAA